jgi:hypothetical protein
MFDIVYSFSCSSTQDEIGNLELIRFFALSSLRRPDSDRCSHTGTSLTPIFATCEAFDIQAQRSGRVNLSQLVQQSSLFTVALCAIHFLGIIFVRPLLCPWAPARTNHLTILWVNAFNFEHLHPVPVSIQLPS